MRLTVHRRILVTAVVLGASFSAVAQDPPASRQPVKVAAPQSGRSLPISRLVILVTDENGVAVPSAHVTLSSPNSSPLHGETDYAGRLAFNSLPRGAYVVVVEKPGFYRLNAGEVNVGQTDTLEATLTHEQEVRETIDVTESPPTIDADQTARAETLTSREILNVPYPTSRDIRNALPLLPGIVRDQSGLIHVGGASITQTYYLLDGFNIGPPTTSFGDLHVSADAVRTIEAETSRYSAQYGKGTSILGLNTGIGDDKFRFTATNFIPSFQLKKGLNFNQWVPRASFSGPIKKGKAWFFDSPDAEYDQTIIKELPPGSDRGTSWRISNLSKVQVNIKPNNILSTELLVNSFHATNAGLSALNPAQTTVNSRATAWLAAIRDQHYFHSGALVEAGFAVENFANSSTPLGDIPYTLQPGKIAGSYYETTNGDARRIQGNANLFFAPVQWHGRHEFKVGFEGDSIDYARDFLRRPVFILRNDQTLGRESIFSPAPHSQVSNFEATSYLQDRWTPTDRLLIESGIRLDWDQIIRDALVSPRFAATYMVPGAREIKLSAGVGVFYQATNLDLIARPQAGTRQDVFLSPDGVTPLGPPVTTQFFVDRSTLEEPHFLSWSLGLEGKLPHAIYAHLDFVQKRGSDGFVFQNPNPSQPVGSYILTNARNDHYNAFTVSLRHTFAEQYPLFFAYTRSSARTDHAFDFNHSTPVIGLQQAGPLPWDTPNRFLAWGWTPFFKKMTLGYALEWRDGYPFTAVNQLQEITGSADAYRFPAYYHITISLEKRFHLMGYYLALRGTAENITNRQNPNSVDNNVDSPGFLNFSGTDHRAFTARIRFLGRTRDKDNPKATQPNSQP